MLVWFIIAILVLFLIFYLVSKNSQQSFNLIDEVKDMFG